MSIGQAHVAAAEALVRRYYDAFNRGDAEAMVACVSDTVAHDVNQGERRVGKTAFRSFCAHMSQCYRERLTDMVFMTALDGKRAAVEFVVHGTYLATDEGLPPANGQTYVLPAGAFLALDEGRIARITTYYNLQDWVAQVSGSSSSKNDAR